MEPPSNAVLVCGHAHSGFRRAHDLLVGAGLPPAGVRAQAYESGLLERWAAAGPDAGFVLVYAAPGRAVAAALHGHAAVAGEIRALVDDWFACNDALLRYHNRQPGHCLLVDEASLEASAAAFVQHAVEALGLPLHSPDAASESDAAGGAPAGALVDLLSHALVRGDRKAAALYLELSSQSTLDPRDASPAGQAPENAWNEFAALAAECDALRAQARELQRERDDVALQAGALQSRVNSLTQDHELSLTQLQQLQKELETQHLRTQDLKASSEAKATTARAAAEQAANELQLQLQWAATEREQFAAQVQILQAQLTETTAEADRLRAERERQPDPEPLQANVKELMQENELLLLQLHRVQEELEHHYLQHLDLKVRAESQAPLLTFMREHWPANRPGDLMLDMRRPVAGNNWHEAEADGRWAGPATTSSLTLPALRPGLYSVQLGVADAMQLDILTGLELSLDGAPVELEPAVDGLPAVLIGNVRVPSSERPTWELHFRFPRTLSPRERGEDDPRQLAMRLSSVTLTWLEPA